MLWLHDLSPIAILLPQVDIATFSIGPFPLRWYGLAYVAGFLLGWKYFKWVLEKYPYPKLSSKQVDDLLIWVVLGVILGGRLGYVLFYQPMDFLQNPASILQLWNGGMSFHGGFAGVVAALLLFARKHKLSVFEITDRVPATACFGLFFGRLANFVNGELWGRPTDGTWGIIFPYAGPDPRHPSQLYEAVLEGLVLFIILHFVMLKVGIKRHLLPAIFLIGYGAFRILVEFFREPDPQFAGTFFETITMGQVLSLPMVVTGAILAYVSTKKKA
jgi:phosphatidylglycerol:prolipoprotein diacylglycerol transferase